MSQHLLVDIASQKRKNRKFENEKKEVRSIESPFNVFKCHVWRKPKSIFLHFM